MELYVHIVPSVEVGSVLRWLIPSNLLDLSHDLFAVIGKSKSSMDSKEEHWTMIVQFYKEEDSSFPMQGNTKYPIKQGNLYISSQSFHLMDSHKLFICHHKQNLLQLHHHICGIRIPVVLNYTHRMDGEKSEKKFCILKNFFSIN